MTFAVSHKLPPVRVPYNALVAHALLQRVFLPDSLSVEDITIRHWFTESIVSAFKAYDEIRKLVFQHEQQDQVQQGYLILFFLDVPRNLESLISIINRICVGIKIYSKRNKTFKDLQIKYEQLMRSITTLRNNFEHFTNQLNNQAITAGAVNIVFSAEGEVIEFRNNSVLTSDLITFLEDVFTALCCLYPDFNQLNTSINNKGNLKLSTSIEVEKTTK